jgi:hypothetical protein
MAERNRMTDHPVARIRRPGEGRRQCLADA